MGVRQYGRRARKASVSADRAREAGCFYSTSESIITCGADGAHLLQRVARSCYIGLGRVFVANMTGNVVLLAFAAAEVSGLSVTALYRPLAALLSARQSAESSAPPWRPSSRLRLILSAGIIEALLIFAAAVSAIRFDMRSSAPTHQLHAMIVLTALSMGLRNATVRQLFQISRLRFQR